MTCGGGWSRRCSTRGSVEGYGPNMQPAAGEAPTPHSHVRAGRHTCVSPLCSASMTCAGRMLCSRPRCELSCARSRTARCSDTCRPGMHVRAPQHVPIMDMGTSCVLCDTGCCVCWAAAAELRRDVALHITLWTSPCMIQTWSMEEGHAMQVWVVCVGRCSCAELRQGMAHHLAIITTREPTCVLMRARSSGLE